MISAARFAQSEPELFKATKDFVQSFSCVTDPVIFVSGKAKTLEEKIAWTILGSALFQGISYTDLMKLLIALYKAFPGERLWTLPVPKDSELSAIVSTVLEGKPWSLAEHVPGIFWSVGSFVRHHRKDEQDLSQWVTASTAADLWKALSEIYFMGKEKPRPKACATLYRLISTAPLGLGIGLKGTCSLPPIPLTMGMRRYLSILGPGKYLKFSELSPNEKQKMAQGLLTELSSTSPYVASHGLEFFLESGKAEFICREHFKACCNCPLYKFCKYALRK